MNFSNILVIKLGALGDFVQATPAFEALRKRFPHACLTLLTTAPYREFGQKLGFFQKIMVDQRLKAHKVFDLFSFLRTLQRQQFDCVIDLQNVDRTRLYSWFLKCPWYGPFYENAQHPQQRFTTFLKNMGIDHMPSLNLEKLGENFTGPIPRPYVLVVPGSSGAHDGAKCLSQENYAFLCQKLLEKGIHSLIMGGKGQDFSKLQALCPEAINLVGQTSFYHIISLAKHAVFAVGNDTGPMLLAASGGCPTITFYSDKNPPTIGGALGENHFSVHVSCLKSLGVQEMIQHVCKIPIWPL